MRLVLSPARRVDDATLRGMDWREESIVRFGSLRVSQGVKNMSTGVNRFLLSAQRMRTTEEAYERTYQQSARSEPLRRSDGRTMR